MRGILKGMAGALLAALLLPAGAGTLVIESWRVDDQGLWENLLLPAFARHHPDVTVRFAPTGPTGVDAALAGRLWSCA
ncbi:hypothetical protein ACFOHT_01075 [Massilia oculi]|nr:hypothetical protein [Massilia oculi]